MKAVVGLRNPGPEYSFTRHNVGHEVVDRLVAEAGSGWNRGPSRVRCETATLRIGDISVVAGAPVTFMNQSGEAVSGLISYFGVDPADLLVCHDDIDLPFGRLRLQVGGGHGGHNGLRSIERSIGTRDFLRLKVGVGRPPGRMDPADFVLRRFTRSERAEVEMLVVDAAEVAASWVDDAQAATRQAGERKPS